MTRINCTPPLLLLRKFLVSEYREMLRLRHVKHNGQRIPPTYRMGKGHVTFFYDKGAYLERRHDALRAEMRRRGMAPKYRLRLRGVWPSWAMNDWQPDVDARLTNVARILNRADVF